MPSSARPASYAYPASAAILAGMLALVCAALVLAAFQANWMYWMPSLAGLLFLLFLYVCRNVRLALFIGLVFTSTLALAINLRKAEHMGGAFAFSIDISDFFLVPLLLFIARDFLRGERTLRFSRISLWWFALIALGMWTVLAGPYREFAAKEVVRMLQCWALFFVIINECVRERHFQYVVGALAASVAVSIVVAMLEYMIQRDLGLQPLGEGAYQSILGASYGVNLGRDLSYRVTGLMGHPNLFGAALAMLLPLFIASIYTNISRGTRLVLLMICAGGAAALLLTLSRSGWAAAATSIGVLTLMVFVHPALRRRYTGLKSVMLMLILVGALVSAGPVITRLTESDPGATDFRYDWIRVAWRMVEDRPVLGFGLNTFIWNLRSESYQPYGAEKMRALFSDLWPVVHNTYMLVWAEQGTVGLALFIGMHLHLLWIGYQNLRYRLSERVLMISLGATCGVLAILVDSMASFFIRVPAHARMFWIVVALIVAANYWNRANAPLRGSAAAPAPRGAAPDPAPAGAS
jgi:putative inorganic carbon (HCO3(-)) transporter